MEWIWWTQKKTVRCNETERSSISIRKRPSCSLILAKLIVCRYNYMTFDNWISIYLSMYKWILLCRSELPSLCSTNSPAENRQHGRTIANNEIGQFNETETITLIKSENHNRLHFKWERFNITHRTTPQMHNVLECCLHMRNRVRKIRAI